MQYKSAGRCMIKLHTRQFKVQQSVCVAWFEICPNWLFVQIILKCVVSMPFFLLLQIKLEPPNLES